MTALGLKIVILKRPSIALEKCMLRKHGNQCRNGGMYKSDASGTATNSLVTMRREDESLLKKYVHNMW
jgi:hypothetical protein